MQTKSEKIKQSLKETREKRLFQDCRVFELKLDKSHFSNKTEKDLNRLFLEGKWLYNSILSNEDIFKYDTKVSKVQILNKDKVLEDRNLEIISSQIKQGIHDRLCSNIKGLSQSKKNGRRIGKLKFKSVVNSLYLKQFDNTYKIYKNRISIQGIKQKLRVLGLKQIPENAEFANATLIRKHRDYFLKVTTYIPKESSTKIKSCIGIDFGIATQMAFSNGIKVESKIPVSESTKKAGRQVSKSKKNSRNRFKLRMILQKRYERTNNQKKDIRKKIVSYLKNNYTSSVQNEMIKQWQSGRFGKAINESAIGGIISEIKNLSDTHVVRRSFPSTKLCPNCGCLNDIKLSDRYNKCDCGYEKDRDIKSAINMLNEIPMERRKLKPSENCTSAEMLEYFKTIPNISVSLIQ